MPPRKKDLEVSTKIKNMYEHIPRSLLDKVENPNYHLHKLKIPMRMCIVAPSGSGKTNYLVNLLHLFSQGKGTFSTIHIITRNKDEPLYKWLEQISEGQIIISEGIHTIPDLDKFDKKENHLVVFDDLVLSKDQSKIEQYYIRARKLSCSVIYLSQSYYRIPKMIRSNCSYLVLLKLSGQREVNMILSECSLGLTKDQLLKMYKHATSEKFSALLIDFEAEAELEQRFRKGIDEILDPNDYV
jgi:hypothetical protein